MIKEIVKATPHLLKFPKERMWIDYDREADVLSVGSIVRCRNREWVILPSLDENLVLRDWDERKW